MSREALYESLSAVMDDEADELELRRVLAASGDDAELRRTWSRYQMARAAMHKELLEPRLDIATAVSAALANEAVHRTRRLSWWGAVGRVAVAASVTVAVLAGVRLYNQKGPDEMMGQGMAQQAAQPSLSVPQMQGTPVLAGYSENAEPSPAAPPAEAGKGADWHEKRLPIYLRQHAQQSAVNGVETVLPYARAASLENR